MIIEDFKFQVTGVMLIMGNLTKIESGDQKGELSWITTGVQIQEELSIMDLNRRIINRKEQSIIGPDSKRCTLYVLQDISKKKKKISATQPTRSCHHPELPLFPVSIASKEVLSASFSFSLKECSFFSFVCNLPMLLP